MRKVRRKSMGTAGEPAAVAVSVVEMAVEGRFGEIEELFAPSLRAVVSARLLQTAWLGEIGKRGGVSVVGQPVSEAAGAGLVRVSVPVGCQQGGIALVVVVDEVGMLHGLQLAPATTVPWEPPSYAEPERFSEQDVTLAAGADAVPGTLSLPHGRGPWPGVVLLSGGGPFDRDETSGPNKPLKDLAWGLASRGVAVLRFDKVTYADHERMASSGFTMTGEYVPFAVAAVRLLRGRPEVDPARVFVVGHSMGGKVAPRVAVAEESVAGLVIMAGDTQPMHRSAVRVARHLASVHPDAIPEGAVESFIEQASMVDSPDLSPSTPATALPFGLPASYWLDLRDYDPVATAAALGKPILILQGGRDYQVTVADDLSGWRAGLAHRPDVTIRVYDADNHLFFPGEGVSTPEEYEVAQHVDPAVVEDIAKWLVAERGASSSLEGGC
ncbi:dienelactone hydrolase [Nonomuraea thailandensis]|uniref:Dienelactone hydrolase n=1 Tax=Nonomuraea thailandensis TaxID=1188745 RepID=A0A9X2GLT2_9ACTN|nr:alpha/beta fold hydrolase [Nonomuraea thailandensis]MCP2361191.1 dienelactone hydrolase [Nonomuraea thailandensis]